jgi:hypothetical protein
VASRREELKVDLVANDQLSKTVNDAADRVDALDGNEVTVALEADDQASETVEEATGNVDEFDGSEGSAALDADDQASAAADEATGAVEAFDEVAGIATADLADNASADVAEVQAAVEGLDDVTGTVSIEVDDAEVSAIDDIATDVEAVEGDHGGAVSLEGAEETAGVTGSIVDNLTEAFGAGGLVAGGVAGLVALGVEAAEDVADIESMTNAVGGTTEEVSALLDAWEFVGGSADSLEQTVIRVNDKLRDETNGLAEQLGINITDAKSPLDLFIEAVGVLNSGQLTANERLAIAMDLFGRKGLLTLNDLQTHVGDLQTAMEEAGEEVLIHEEDVDAARRVREQWDAIGDKISEIQRNLLPALVPILEQMSGLLEDFLGGGNDSGNIFGIGMSEEDLAALEALEGIDFGDFGGGEFPIAEIDDATRAIEDQTKALEAQRDALEESRDAHLDLIDAQREQTDAAYAARDAERDFRAQVADTTAALDEHSNESDEGQAALDALALAAADAADAQVDLLGDTASATAKIDTQNRSLLTSASTLTGPMQDAILGYIADLNGIPPEVVSQIKAALDRGDIAEAERLLSNASRTRSAAIQAQADAWALAKAERELAFLTRDRTVDISVRYHRPTVDPDRRAAGGPVTAGLAYTVGETGRELFVPDQDGTIINASKTAALLDDGRHHLVPAAGFGGRGGDGGGDVFHVSINMPPGANGEDVLRSLQQLQRRMGPLPLRVSSVA